MPNLFFRRRKKHHHNDDSHSVLDVTAGSQVMYPSAMYASATSPSHAHAARVSVESLGNEPAHRHSAGSDAFRMFEQTRASVTSQDLEQHQQRRRYRQHTAVSSNKQSPSGRDGSSGPHTRDTHNSSYSHDDHLGAFTEHGGDSSVGSTPRGSGQRFLDGDAHKPSAIFNLSNGATAAPPTTTSTPPGPAASQQQDETRVPVGRVVSVRNERPEALAASTQSSNNTKGARARKQSEETGTDGRGPLRWLRNRFGGAKDSRERRYALSHSHADYDGSSPLFFLHSSAAMKGSGSRHARTRVKGLGLSPYLRYTHHARHMFRTISELVLIIVMIAFLASGLLYFGLHAHVRDDAPCSATSGSAEVATRRATAWQCFQSMLSLLLTNSDDWCAVRLSMDGAVYVTAMAVSVLGTLLRLAFLGFFIMRLSKRPPFILFSKWICMGDNREITSRKTLEFRIGNLYGTSRRILQARVQVTMGFTPRLQHGSARRRFIRLPLVAHETAAMPVMWSCVHVIDSESPLLNENWEKLHAQDIEFSVLLSGIDEKSMQPVYHYHQYTSAHLLTDAAFKPMTHHKKNKVVFDFTKFHCCSVLRPVNRQKQN
ncbi:hypothetical protein PTSG_08486 [Salpingoeca rosetta]|uniref:Inward rectifier potassium channel C-terminal domain-containing protein n=1 Tax=Salpingoeca rosetta (strain ATCC 50818 / BSB-021) TaxID=946362 RepID=F2UJU2_SALR5|nr:uncharacterized protein PTSG_08486 [Salpingoeca rosetta]EGD77391.1 hypothetical protein PTSG_08486 [Salpingoeca rosetta]|eukprot:XP_004990735.1 hypothetical protein PTSG_08486 [Salpingoeca rosetta]